MCLAEADWGLLVMCAEQEVALGSSVETDSRGYVENQTVTCGGVPVDSRGNSFIESMQTAR